ncbi:hypothetical protein G6F55_007803 [Rhizopus delemar]|uniref:Polysaccharide lyase 14 domain-containing protein n=3 Tax=Rhizopus TaxID=4842 RepID=I1BKX0_RHIO9|nr:hypothetical protein RO3G_01554 [Rhizopus delemar RA 99-880]KAG1454066.1 hypothetical protein G6F55_007803 [Rhizopus delemar]KAG1536080.1 hypothetical protein G6F51_011166 [Rhizopus arrhizus]KAG1490373.1 hypothetical protein G6F54_010769 [Rhizopus delemar]KAG1511709.1 hypothetical protein G6F53_005733 [Rhizopus delemar]|eukprot:EIE76850.1 hypothetical protein RO3G_01554 [Rhizopus delemar RA 99-880]
MAYNRLLLFVCIALLSILYTEASEATELEKRGSNSWYFSNWNKYKSDTIVGLTSQWNEKWKIPKHRGWLWAWSGYEDSNAAVKDPAKKNSNDYVLRVKYNAHSRNPEGSLTGGLGFLAEPITVSKRAKTVSLQYSVYFPKNFDFVKGGKLPGVFGGNGECTGGDESGSCFTSRLMWRDDGLGEIYAYLPHNKQRSDICDNKVNICNSDYGYSLGRGQFEFKKGAWTTVRQVLTLNQVNKRNGRMILYVNGVKKVDIKNVVIRTSTTPNTVGIMFHTFFGGSDNTWATPKTQYSYFKNFKFQVN